MFVVFGFVLGIAVLELVCLRLDKKRKRPRTRHDGKSKTASSISPVCPITGRRGIRNGSIACTQRDLRTGRATGFRACRLRARRRDASRHDRTRIERRIFERARGCFTSIVRRTSRAIAPSRRAQCHGRRRFEALGARRWHRSAGQARRCRSGAARCRKQWRCRSESLCAPRSIARKVVLERCRAAIVIEIAVSRTSAMRVAHFDFDPRRRHYRPPEMPRIAVDRIGPFAASPCGYKPNACRAAAAEAARRSHRWKVKARRLSNDIALRPISRCDAERDSARRPRSVIAQRLPSGAVEHDVERAMIEGSAPPRRRARA